MRSTTSGMSMSRSSAAAAGGWRPTAMQGETCGGRGRESQGGGGRGGGGGGGG
jgi:hypothetical protein